MGVTNVHGFGNGLCVPSVRTSRVAPNHGFCEDKPQKRPKATDVVNVQGFGNGRQNVLVYQRIVRANQIIYWLSRNFARVVNRQLQELKIRQITDTRSKQDRGLFVGPLLPDGETMPSTVLIQESITASSTLAK